MIGIPDLEDSFQQNLTNDHSPGIFSPRKSSLKLYSHPNYRQRISMQDYVQRGAQIDTSIWWDPQDCNKQKQYKYLIMLSQPIQKLHWRCKNAIHHKCIHSCRYWSFWRRKIFATLTDIKLLSFRSTLQKNSTNMKNQLPVRYKKLYKEKQNHQPTE